MEEDVNKGSQVTEDPFTQMMFGSRAQSHVQEPPQYEQPSIDYGELMVSIDTLIESARNLKPLFQKVLPYIEQWWKKG